MNASSGSGEWPSVSKRVCLSIGMRIGKTTPAHKELALFRVPSGAVCANYSKPMSKFCFAALVSLLSVLTSQAAVVINEIHYNPDIKTEQVEFIELYNTDATAVDLSGWAFTDAVDYVFPAGTL